MPAGVKLSMSHAPRTCIAASSNPPKKHPAAMKLQRHSCLRKREFEFGHGTVSLKLHIVVCNSVRKHQKVYSFYRFVEGYTV